MEWKKTMQPPAILTVSIDPALKDLIGNAADTEGMTMNEWVARVCASALERPDLAKIPRKSLGRPRKQPA